MGTPHKHRDLIVAWANGAEIQFLDDGEWVECHEYGPRWHEEKRYRVKPKTVKHEGWMNVYDGGEGHVYPTKEKADRFANSIRKACIRIEWEEEV